MIEKNKSLVLKKDTIFSKIKSVFKNIFGRIFNNKDNAEETNIVNKDIENHFKIEEKKVLKENNEEIIEDSNDIESEDNFFKKHNYIHDLDHEEQKKKIFALYKEVKEGKKSFDDLNAMELIQVTRLFEEEVKLMENKLKIV